MGMNEQMFNNIKNIILENYLYDIDEETLYEGAIEGMFKVLDNHSYYMKKKDMGSFYLKETQALETNIINEKIGYIKIATFMDDNIPNEIEKIIKDLKEKNISKIILDLRNNFGGNLKNSIEISKYFINKDVTISIKNKYDDVRVYKINQSTKLFDQLVVLIDNATASAAEVLAAAIQQSKSGILVGERSYGKTSVQTLIELENKDLVKLTVGKYFINNGDGNEECGLEPDTVVSRLNKELDEYSKKRAVLRANLSKDSIGPDVMSLQFYLKVLGFYSKNLNGVFDEATLRALKEFKKGSGLLEDGVVDRVTLKALKETVTDYIYNKIPDNQIEKAIDILSK